MTRKARYHAIARSTLAVAVVGVALSACERSANLLTPIHSDASVAPLAARATGDITRGRMLSREEARSKGIVDARRALDHARRGGSTGLSDGRRLTGAENVRFWERMVHALETGASPRSALAVAPSSTGTMSDATASDEGPAYIYGSTNVYRYWGMASVDAFTSADGAATTSLNGFLTVELQYTNLNGSGGFSTFRDQTTMYFGGAKGDYASVSVDSLWDNNWYGEFAYATTNHEADYGTVTVSTSSFGNA